MDQKEALWDCGKRGEKGMLPVSIVARNRLQARRDWGWSGRIGLCHLYLCWCVRRMRGWVEWQASSPQKLFGVAFAGAPRSVPHFFHLRFSPFFLGETITSFRIWATGNSNPGCFPKEILCIRPKLTAQTNRLPSNRPHISCKSRPYPSLEAPEEVHESYTSSRT